MSYLIIGGTSENRRQKALEMAKSQFHASSFDTIIIGSEIGIGIGIGQIRELSHRLNFKPYNSETKVAIIHPGELLTAEAQASLLKTLEEPNFSSVLILTAPQTDFLLATIVSRCQIIKLPTKPEIELDKKLLSAFYFLLSTIINAGAGERLKFASTVGKNREETKEWLTKMLYFFREILLSDSGQAGMTITSRHSERSEESLANASGANKLRDFPPEAGSRYGGTSASSLRMTPLQIVEVIRNLEKTRGLLDQNINHKLALEIFLLDLPIPDVRS